MNHYAQVIDICTSDNDWRAIVIEIAKKHPKIVIDASAKFRRGQWQEDARRLYFDLNDKIAAIKLCRAETGMSLYDAKNAIESLKSDIK